MSSLIQPSHAHADDDHPVLGGDADDDDMAAVSSYLSLDDIVEYDIAGEEWYQSLGETAAAESRSVQQGHKEPLLFATMQAAGGWLLRPWRWRRAELARCIVVSAKLSCTNQRQPRQDQPDALFGEHGRDGGSRRLLRSGHGKIAFKTRSDVDVLDDEYRWRKYGKKLVKNSPNPRNYYRCSSEGYRVKKRVERQRDDARFVITTYDGVHNHPPAAPPAATV